MAILPDASMLREPIDCVPLGQSGFRFALGSTVLYVDPYLSDSVEEAEGPELARQVPIWKAPDQVGDADWVLITHGHMDHCDLDTLVPLSRASGECRFLGPRVVTDVLVEAGIDPARIVVAGGDWIALADELRVHAVLAAHPDIDLDQNGDSNCIGYCIEYRGRRVYHSGDTQLCSPVLQAAMAFKPIEVAMIPVNERNYYRESRGIIGNMSVRDAFQFALDLEVDTFVPVHWDMFELNSVHPEEIEAHFLRTQPGFQLLLRPRQL